MRKGRSLPITRTKWIGPNNDIPAMLSTILVLAILFTPDECIDNILAMLLYWWRGHWFTSNSSVASLIWQGGKSEGTFPIFSLFPDFFPLFPLFLIFSSFPDLWQIFRCQGGHSAPLDPPVAVPLTSNSIYCWWGYW